MAIITELLTAITYVTGGIVVHHASLETPPAARRERGAMLFLGPTCFCLTIADRFRKAEWRLAEERL